MTRSASRSSVVPSRRVLGVALLTCVSLAPALRADDSLCPYGKLKWADFQGTPDANSPYDAETAARVGWDGGVDGVEDPPGTFKAKIKDLQTWAKFKKRESWVKPGTETDALLEHEQYHMDLYEYWARELEKLLRDISVTSGTQQGALDALDVAIADAEAKCDTDCEALQEAYDAETKHGTDAAKQAEWCKKIGDLLDPPEPGTDVIEPSSGGVDSNADGSAIEGFSPVQSFSCEGVPFADPALQGGVIQLPTLGWQGYHMDGMHPMLMPPANGDDTLRVLAPGGAVAMTGHLRLLFGDEAGTTYRGWVEGVLLDPALLPASTYLQLVQSTLASGEALVVLQLQLPVTLEQATNNFTTPANLPAQFTLGSAIEPFLTFADLGGALAGTNGEPNLLAVGALQAGEVVDLIVNHGRPFAASWLVLGLGQLGLPFKGGTLVPTPDVLIGPIPLDDTGLLVLPAVWPPLPPLVSIYAQTWVQDALAVHGFAATNGLKITTPP